MVHLCLWYLVMIPLLLQLVPYNLVLLWTYMRCKEACLRHNGATTSGFARYIPDHDDLVRATRLVRCYHVKQISQKDHEQL